MAVQQTLEALEALITPVLDEQGCELVDLEYLQDRGRWVVRVFADRPEGITLDDCARLSREVGDLLDVKNVIEHEYVLEISSPGLDRPLKKEKDFSWAVGREVKVSTRTPVEGRRNFQGPLERFEDGLLSVRVDKELFRIPFSEVRKANLLYQFPK